MRVEALVGKRPVSIAPDATVRQAAEILASERVGLLVMVSKSDRMKVAAVVSERDVVRAVSRGLDLSSRVDSISTKNVISVRRNDPLSKALNLMLANRIRHLVVENEDGTLYGVLSIRDILSERHMLEQLIHDEAIETQGMD